MQANPPETQLTDISLSQYLAIQEKGVSAWEFEPELEIANCFVEGRTEIEFFDSVCSVQSNLPVPKQNEVYYWEAKIYDKPETSLISIGMTTKPYPLFRLPGEYLCRYGPHFNLRLIYPAYLPTGYHKCSVAYLSSGQRRYNQPFTATNYGPEYVQGDVIGVGYRPRTGTIFFTRNGKKLEDVAHGLKAQNFFPTVGANGPCTVHVNFGQMGFVFIEANVKKWGLAPMTGSLAPPPPYGSEQGSILLEAGRDGITAGGEVSSGAGGPTPRHTSGHSRSRSGINRVGFPISPGPPRSPTEISLAHLASIPSQSNSHDPGEGGSSSIVSVVSGFGYQPTTEAATGESLDALMAQGPEPPEYTSPQASQQTSDDDGEETEVEGGSSTPRVLRSPPIPTYHAAVADTPRGSSFNNHVHDS